jgi:hypothetical protein
MAGPYWQAAGPQLTLGRGVERRRIERDLERGERTEEALIVQALADGVDVMRRPDADPRAILGIVVTKVSKKLVA